MISSERYARAKARLLNHPAICEANRMLFTEFLAFEEYKLKRRNGLPDLDAACRSTLYGYLQRLANVNAWFGNTPWKEITKADIKRVYDALEEGRILTRTGTPFQDRTSYYNKIFKSKPFQLAGKDGLAREVIEFSTPHHREVRFLTEASFRSLVECVGKPVYRLLLWLAWDIGENINAMLQLRPRDFIAQTNRHTGEREYVVNLAVPGLKRSRQSRSEVTLYPETARLIDQVLPTRGADERVFGFEHRQASKMLARAVRDSGATTMPSDQPVRWKDFRSGMACHLLKSGWTRDEVRARLGHTPNSTALNAYINFLALDRSEPKRRMQSGETESLRQRLSEAAQTVRVTTDRLNAEEERSRRLSEELERTRQAVSELRETVAAIVKARAA